MPPAFRLSSITGGPSGALNSSTIVCRAVRDTPPCRNGIAVPSRFSSHGSSIRPKVVYWVNTSTRSSASTAASMMRSSSATFPERCRPRASIGDPSPWKCAGWLQICFSFVMPFSTSARRFMPFAARTASSSSSTHPW